MFVYEGHRVKVKVTGTKYKNANIISPPLGLRDSMTATVATAVTASPFRSFRGASDRQQVACADSITIMITINLLRVWQTPNGCCFPIYTRDVHGNGNSHSHGISMRMGVVLGY